LYNEDLETGSPPEAWTKFRAEIRTADAVLFVTPEYNRSIPGCLKNALDVGSRPSGKNVFDGLAAGVVSVTPYGLGGFGANHALRQTFVFLNMLVLQQPEAYVSEAGDLLNEKGAIASSKTARFFEQLMIGLERWTRTVRAAAAASGFEAFMKRRREIALDYVNGDPDSLVAVATRADPATFYPPTGGYSQGAEAIATRYKTDSKAFQKGATTSLEVLHCGASGELAYWTGLQHAEVRMGPGGAPVSMTLRVTEVFRFEEGAFKLVHRHADTGAAPPK
jgi:NAD(P)H-dependent FMN reductase/ketosteroid isomerase-like protein